jgi:hypothetical protein
VIGRFRQLKLMTVPEFFEIKYSRGLRLHTEVLVAVGGILNMGGFPQDRRRISHDREWDQRQVPGRGNQNIQAVRPGMEVFKVSAKTREGMNEYLEMLEHRRASSRAVTAV